MNKARLFFMISVIMILSLEAKATQECPAVSADEFLTKLELDSWIGGEVGFYAPFDYIENDQCKEGFTTCDKHQYFFAGLDGYYADHTVYYITYGGKVIFAKASEYFELTYGTSLGIANAKLLRDEQFKKLSEETGCLRTENHPGLGLY